jgi:hypothetical protein
VATYAYVNPIVAVFPGWLVPGEPISSRTVLAAAIIVGAVALIASVRAGGGSSSGGKRLEPADDRGKADQRRERPAA